MADAFDMICLCATRQMAGNCDLDDYARKTFFLASHGVVAREESFVPGTYYGTHPDDRAPEGSYYPIGEGPYERAYCRPD